MKRPAVSRICLQPAPLLTAWYHPIPPGHGSATLAGVSGPFDDRKALIQDARLLFWTNTRETRSNTHTRKRSVCTSPLLNLTASAKAWNRRSCPCQPPAPRRQEAHAFPVKNRKMRFCEPVAGKPLGPIEDDVLPLHSGRRGQREDANSFLQAGSTSHYLCDTGLLCFSVADHKAG